jgi:cysteine desulfurase
VLETEGVSVTYLRSDCGGLVKPSEVVAALREDTILITVSHANSEIGCVQPIEAIVEAVKAARPEVLIHVDGVQTVGHMSYDLRHLPIDLLSFTAHKFYGPKGIGGLFIRAGVELSTVRGRGRDDDSVARGTEAVPLIVGMAAALEYSCGRIGFNDSKWLPVRNLVASRLQDDVADCRLNGDPVARLSTNVNISFRGVSGEDLVILLDRCGYAVSTGSACTTGRVDPSHVLLAIGCNREEALGAIRLTFGDASSACNVDDLLNTINELVAGQRALSYRPTRTNSTRERTS